MSVIFKLWTATQVAANQNAPRFAAIKSISIARLVLRAGRVKAKGKTAITILIAGLQKQVECNINCCHTQSVGRQTLGVHKEKPAELSLALVSKRHIQQLE